MKILSLKLSGYNRFILSNLTNFEINATSNIQLILGTNGSGKSSLLEALSPYPQPRSDFVRGGSKYLEIEHNHSHYLLISKYNSVVKHQFVRDGVNLNKGGTATVQKELVQKELSFTSQLHDLLTGKLTFTKMTPIQRREWIMKISNIDLDYALSKYDDIKTRLRDAQGALKHEEIRLGRESQKLLSEAYMKSMNEENKTLQKQISFYLKELKSDKVNLSDLKNRYAILCRDIEKNSKSILNFKFNYKDKHNLKKYDEIIELENKLNSKDKSLYSLLLELESQLMEDKEILKQLKKDGVENKKGLKNKLSKLKKKRKTFDKMKFVFSMDGDLYSTLNDSQSIRMTLNELVSEAKGSSIIVPEMGLWEEYKNRLVTLDNEISKLDFRLINLLKRKEIIETSQENTCPKCKYIWKPGISEIEIKKISKEIEVLKEKIKDLNIKKGILIVECEHIDIRRDEVNRFRSLAHSYPRLRNYWMYIAEAKFLYNNPQTILDYYSIWIDELEKRIEIGNLDNDIESIEVTLQRLENEESNVNIDYITKREKGIKNKINNILNEIEKVKNALKDLTKYKNDYLYISGLVTELTNQIKDMKVLEYEIVENTIQSEINDRLSNTQVSLANNHRKKTEADTLVGIINDLKVNIGNLKKDIKSLSALEEALSPNNGLIADTLESFIDVFINQLNALIERVWEYDLKISTCSNNNGELDYKFPFRVVGRESPIDDIADGSTGQREIIDFVFMITVMVYMDLIDFPLFLDEMGSSFDETHKSKLVMFIKWLLETKHCSQIWMVSHFAADHGGLTEAETCVLDGSNIAIPDNSNLHVNMN